jgi:hypothetical protein
LRTPGQHLWRKVPNRTLWSLAAARSGFTPINLVHRLRDAKVGDLCAPFTVNQNVP